MSVLIYQGRRPENQLQVKASDVVSYLMNGYFIVPYGIIKAGK